MSPSQLNSEAAHAGRVGTALCALRGCRRCTEEEEEGSGSVSGGRRTPWREIGALPTVVFGMASAAGMASPLSRALCTKPKHERFVPDWPQVRWSESSNRALSPAKDVRRGGSPLRMELAAEKVKRAGRPSDDVISSKPHFATFSMRGVPAARKRTMAGCTQVWLHAWSA